MRMTAIAGLCAVLAALGFVLGRFSAGEVTRMEPVSASDSGTAEALREVRVELAALKQTLSELQFQSPTRTNVDSTSDAGSGELMAELRRLLARSAQGVEGAPSESRSNEEKGYVSRPELEAGMARVQLQLRRCGEETLGDEYAAAQESFEKAHVLWTVQEILARYGPPDKVEPAGNGIRMRYDFPKTAEMSFGYASFWIVEGFIVDSRVELDI